MDKVTKKILMNRVKTLIDNGMLKNRQYLREYRGFVTSGATRYVIVFDDMDYVIKIGRRHEHNDYVQAEFQKYKEAALAGMEDYFAETYIIGKISGYFIEAQEKCHCSTEEVSNSVYDSLINKEDLRDEYAEYCENFCYDYGGSPMDYEDWVSDYINDIEDDDYELIKTLFNDDFADYAYDNLNDIHTGNIGRDLITGGWKVVDFAGYWD